MKPELAKKIRQLRKQHDDKTIADFAAELEVSERALSNYELGKRHPDVDFLLRLADVTGTPVLDLISLRLADAGQELVGHVVGEPMPGYEFDRGLRPGPGDSDAPAQVRAELRQADIPMEWALLLMQLVTSGDLQPAGARAIIEFLDTWQPDPDWLSKHKPSEE